jgi:hypothetical protein
MPTVSKEIADELIKNNGKFEDDPPVKMIVQYNNKWGGLSYGITYKEGDNRYLEETEFVRNPVILWKAK